MRELRYRVIADDVRARIQSGEFAGGHLLPSESELSQQFGASRVTVRKALDALRDEGLVDARQGFGWFVAADPLRQTLGRLGTIEGQLAASGRTSERRVLDFGFVRATKRVKEFLGADTVLRVRRVNLADGEPFARVTVWVPESLAGGVSRDAVAKASFYELLPVQVGRAVQTIGAAACTEADAEVLEVPVGSPVLRCERTTWTDGGDPLLVAEHVFPALRTEFVVELPNEEGESMAPSGLRLVE